MTIEASLERIANALESLAATQQTTAAPVKEPKADKPAKTPKVEPAKKPAEPDPKELVGKAIENLLKANKRTEAVDLLATFNGAKSASGVLEQGAEAVAKFLAGAEEILLGA